MLEAIYETCKYIEGFVYSKLREKHRVYRATGIAFVIISIISTVVAIACGSILLYLYYVPTRIGMLLAATLAVYLLKKSLGKKGFAFPIAIPKMEVIKYAPALIVFVEELAIFGVLYLAGFSPYAVYPAILLWELAHLTNRFYYIKNGSVKRCVNYATFATLPSAVFKAWFIATYGLATLPVSIAEHALWDGIVLLVGARELSKMRSKPIDMDRAGLAVLDPQVQILVYDCGGRLCLVFNALGVPRELFLSVMTYRVARTMEALLLSRRAVDNVHRK